MPTKKNSKISSKVMPQTKAQMEAIMEEHGAGGANYNWVTDFVYGGIDGAVTTFAVVAGVEGASLSVPIILILGFANLFADGFSMSIGKYLSDKTNLDQFETIRQAEYRHLKQIPDHEEQEVEDILKAYGFKGQDLERGTKIITSNPDAWVDLMMRHEFNMTLENISPIKGALITFCSFVLIGFIPMIGYVFAPVIGLNSDETFIFTIFSTLLALGVVGTVKSRFSQKSWWKSGLETALIGGVAAAIAYLVGYWLQGIV